MVRIYLQYLYIGAGVFSFLVMLGEDLKEKSNQIKMKYGFVLFMPVLAFPVCFLNPLIYTLSVTAILFYWIFLVYRINDYKN